MKLSSSTAVVLLLFTVQSWLAEGNNRRRNIRGNERNLAIPVSSTVTGNEDSKQKTTPVKGDFSSEAKMGKIKKAKIGKEKSFTKLIKKAKSDKIFKAEKDSKREKSFEPDKASKAKLEKDLKSIKFGKAAKTEKFKALKAKFDKEAKSKLPSDP